MLHARRGITPRCPFCHDDIERGSPERARCGLCRTLHHAECFAENGKCTALGCESSCVVGARSVAGAPPFRHYRVLGATVALVLHFLVLAALPLIVETRCRYHGGGVEVVLPKRAPRPTIDPGGLRAPVSPDDTFADVCAVASSLAVLRDDDLP